MIDWMVEVLTTFKNSDQTFFLAVNLLDRFFQKTERVLTGPDLHLCGVVTMFIASKYEDVIPLLMRTVINKIGHNKFEIPVIEDKEFELLRTLGYRIGAPTVKEFLDRFVEEIGDSHMKSEKFYKISMYLAKMACHNYNLMQLPTSLLAAAVANVALKIYEKIEPKVDTQLIMSKIISFGQLDTIDTKVAAKEMLTFAKNFDKLHPNFKNLRAIYNEEFKSLKPTTSL
jgi:hypothetical protein